MSEREFRAYRIAGELQPGAWDTVIKHLGHFGIISEDIVPLENRPSVDPFFRNHGIVESEVGDNMALNQQRFLNSEARDTYEACTANLDLTSDEKLVLDCIVVSGEHGVQRKDIFDAGLGEKTSWQIKQSLYAKAKAGLFAKLEGQNLPFRIEQVGSKSTRRYLCVRSSYQGQLWHD